MSAHRRCRDCPGEACDFYLDLGKDEGSVGLAVQCHPRRRAMSPEERRGQSLHLILQVLPSPVVSLQ